MVYQKHSGDGLKQLIGKLISGVALAGSLAIPSSANAATGITKYESAANLVFHGGQANQFFGAGIAAGDVNGDGINDLVIGGYGEIGVKYGNPQWGKNTQQTWTSNVPNDFDLRIVGNIYGAIPNYSIMYDQEEALAVGDVNGDGYADIVFGNPYEGTGVVRGLFGKEWYTGTVIDLDVEPLPGIIGFKIEGTDAGDQFGYTVRIANVMGNEIGENGKPIPDIVVSAKKGDGLDNLVPDSGEVHVFRGMNMFPSPMVSEFDVWGKSTVPRSYGLKYITTGEITGDNDKMEDIVIPNVFGPTPAFNGEVYIVEGSVGLSGELNLATTAPYATLLPAMVVEEEAQGNGMGATPSMGDVNGDGNGDLVFALLGGRGRTGEIVGAREIYIIQGPIAPGERNMGENPPNVKIYGEEEGQCGFYKIAIGNVTGDTKNGNVLEDMIFTDLGVVPNPDPSKVYRINGKSTWSGIVDLLEGGQNQTIIGEVIEQGKEYGRVLVLADLNNDGFDDVIAGMMERSPNGNSSGEVKVILSDILGNTTKPTGTTCWEEVDTNGDDVPDAFDLCHKFVPSADTWSYYKYDLPIGSTADAVFCCQPPDAVPDTDYVLFRDIDNDGGSYAYTIFAVNDGVEQSIGLDGEGIEVYPPQNSCTTMPPCP